MVEPEAAASAANSGFGGLKKLLFGSGAAQALQLVSLLWLSRLYKPSQFGLLAEVQSWANGVAVVATLQLHLAIPIAKTDSESHSTATAALILSATQSLIVFPLALLLGSTYTFALALGFFLAAANVVTSYLVYRGDFARLSRYYVMRALTIVVLQGIFALVPLNESLTIAAVLGEAMASGILLLRHAQIAEQPSQWRGSVARALRDYRAFALFGTPQELIAIAAFSAPVLFYARVFGQEASGQYAMASRLVWAPVVLLSGNLAKVLYHKFGKHVPGDLRSLYSIRHTRWWFVAMVVGVVLSFFSRPIVILALGSRWDLAAAMIPYHVVWGAAFILSVPVRAAGRILKLQQYQLVADGFALVAIAAVFTQSTLDPLRTMQLLVLVALAQNGALVVGLTKRLAKITRVNQ